jgi:hypothetical protein
MKGVLMMSKKRKSTRFLGLLAIAALMAISLSVFADDPPTPFLADFNDQTGGNNYGGTVGGFYGRGDPYVQEDWQIALDYDEVGESGLAGDYAWSSTNAALTQGANYTFYGCYVQLRASVATPTDISGFTTLSFDIKLGPETSPHTDWVVRLEDTDGSSEFDNISYSLGTLTTSYQHFDIPLSYFITPPGQVVDLTLAKTIVFDAASPPFGGGTAVMDLVVDNVELTGSATPTPTPTPIPTPTGNEWYVDYDDGTPYNSEGGMTLYDVGWGDPFGSGNDQVTTSIVTVAPSDQAYQMEGTVTNGGPTWSYATWYTRVDGTDAGALDFRSFSYVEVEAAVLGSDDRTWQIRFEDDYNQMGGTGYQLDNVTFSPPLSTMVQTYQIPLTSFTDGDNGNPMDFERANSIVIFSDSGGSGTDPTLNIGLIVSRVSMMRTTAATNWVEYY